MPNPSPKWKDNEGFQGSMKPPIEPDKGPLVRSPICFKAWQDLHDALGKVPNKQEWLRSVVYAAAESEGLL